MKNKSDRIKILVITYIGNIIASPPIVSLISELAKNNFQVYLAYSPSKKYKEPEFKSRFIQKHNLDVEEIRKDIGPKILKNKKPIGVLKRLLLKFTIALPVLFAYQFIFICRRQ